MVYFAKVLNLKKVKYQIIMSSGLAQTSFNCNTLAIDPYLFRHKKEIFDVKNGNDNKKQNNVFPVMGGQIFQKLKNVTVHLLVCNGYINICQQYRIP